MWGDWQAPPTLLYLFVTVQTSGSMLTTLGIQDSVFCGGKPLPHHQDNNHRQP